MRLLLLLVPLLAGCGRAPLEGRAGNAALEAGQPGKALGRYLQGLRETDTTDADLRFRLQNNAALAELARDSARAALAFADAAAEEAPSAGAAARARYHGGIAAAADGQTREALARFRRALLLDGQALDAAYNWEVVARMQQRGGGGDGDGESDDAPAPGPGDTPAPQPEPPAAAPPASAEAPSRPDPSAAPSRLTADEAARLLDALAREEAGLVRRTVRGNPPPARPTRDW